MKKLVLVFALAAILVTGTVFADHPGGLGIGIVGGYYGGVGAGLSLKLPSIPVYWGISLPSIVPLAFGVTGDVYIFDKVLVPNLLHWYLGVGAYASVYLGDTVGLGVGGRIPVGLSLQPIHLLEVFAEFAPQLGMYINSGGIGFNGNWLGGNLGIRLWF